MDNRDAAEQFLQFFHGTYKRFHSRHTPGTYQPSRDAIAVLEHLAQTGPLTVSEAAKHFRRSQSAVSELLDRLEARGLIARMSDERDRRRRLVWLTDTGLDAWRDASSVLSVDELARVFGTMEEGQVAQLLAAFGDFIQIAHSLPSPNDQENPT